MASLARLHKIDMRIGEQPRARLREKSDKRIVLREQNERRNGDAVDNAGAGGAVIIVVSISKAAVSSDDFLVELANGTHGADAVQVDRCRERALPYVAGAASIREENFHS